MQSEKISDRTMGNINSREHEEKEEWLGGWTRGRFKPVKTKKQRE